jgi:hypothetical protein
MKALFEMVMMLLAKVYLGMFAHQWAARPVLYGDCEAVVNGVVTKQAKPSTPSLFKPTSVLLS